MRNRILAELTKHYPQFQPEVVFDVGANVGQSIVEFRTIYPNARVHAMEPVPETFNKLSDFVGQRDDKDMISIHRVALGAKKGVVKITASGTSTGNRIVSREAAEQVELVPMVTGDEFCVEHRIQKVDLLKIDAEGYDLQVLLGFTRMLAEHRVTMVQVEVGLYSGNLRHVPLQDFMNYMFSLNYKLFRIVGLNNIRRIRAPRLAGVDYGDAIFVQA